MFRVAGLLCALTLSSSLMAGELIVEVGAVRSPLGQVRVALYDQAEMFLKPEGMRMAIAKPASRGAMSVRFTDLPEGRYAVALYHDENGNGKLDSNLIGIPKEGTAFSNDGRASFGPPRFAEVAVRVGADEVFVTPATLKY